VIRRCGKDNGGAENLGNGQQEDLRRLKAGKEGYESLSSLKKNKNKRKKNMVASLKVVKGGKETKVGVLLPSLHKETIV